jgi:glycosyltransferase involved in cell wall biosynthesis
VFLHPDDTGASTRSSTLPLARGTSVPVVAVRGTETDPLFSNGENVVFARSLEPHAVAEATLSLLQDPVLAERVASGGRHLYDHHLGWPQIVSALVD